jgi:RND family efflux transporter MFP subunit
MLVIESEHRMDLALMSRVARSRSDSGSRRPRRGVRFTWIGGLLLACLGCSDPTAQRDPEVRPTPVKTVAVAEQEIRRTTTQPATVHAYYRAEIRAKTSGFVREVAADIGDLVEEDAVLAVIDVPELEKRRLVLKAEVARGRSAEQSARAGVQLAEASVRSAEARLASADSQLARAEAVLEAMVAEFDRTQDLVQRGSLEGRILDEARKKRDAATAERQAAQSAIASAQADVAVAKASQQSAVADLAVTQAESEIAARRLEELEVMVDYATIKSPFAGIVTRRSVSPGDLVREESEVGRGEPLFVVSQVDRVRIQMPVPEADAAMVSVGDTIEFSFPSFPNESALEATVTRVAGELDPSTRTMLVEAEVPNSDRKLLPGMFGQATITLTADVAANMLPARAIRFDAAGQSYVYLVDQQQTISIVPVTTGIDLGRSIEVTSGLEPGQQVVDAHLQRFAAGQRVTASEAGSWD